MPLSRQKLKNKNDSGPSSQDCSYSLLTHLPQAVANTFKELKRKAYPELGPPPVNCPASGVGVGWRQVSVAFLDVLGCLLNSLDCYVL